MFAAKHSIQFRWLPQGPAQGNCQGLSRSAQQFHIPGQNGIKFGVPLLYWELLRLCCNNGAESMEHITGLSFRVDEEVATDADVLNDPVRDIKINRDQFPTRRLAFTVHGRSP